MLLLALASTALGWIGPDEAVRADLEYAEATALDIGYLTAQLPTVCAQL